MAYSSAPASTPTPTDTVKTITGVVKDIVQILAIVGAGAWASYRFGLFRERVPRGTISHEITHRTLTETTIHISVTVIFSNTGRVVWSFAPERDNRTTILLVKPIDQEYLESLQERVAAGESQTYQWPVLDDRSLARSLEVEPSDTQEINHEFVIGGGIESILVYSYYGSHDRGWQATTVYDIVGEDHDNDNQDGEAATPAQGDA
jgi:hypothetical protein